MLGSPCSKRFYFLIYRFSACKYLTDQRACRLSEMLWSQLQMLSNIWRELKYKQPVLTDIWYFSSDVHFVSGCLPAWGQFRGLGVNTQCGWMDRQRLWGCVIDWNTVSVGREVSHVVAREKWKTGQSFLPPGFDFLVKDMCLWTVL